jgi:hypothetical protein
MRWADGYDEYGQDIYAHPQLTENGYKVYEDVDGELQSMSKTVHIRKIDRTMC